MAKPPSNLPALGDAVRLRGRTPVGWLVWLHEPSLWSWVYWDTTEVQAGPRVCHLYELERQPQ